MATSSSWRDALMRLHVAGWDTDDIDAACAALAEACDEEAGVGVQELSSARVRSVLGVEVGEGEVSALRILAALRAGVGAESEALREALYDLDAFAYAYAGDD